MRYAVFADLSRPLTKQERLFLFEAIDTTVPGSGCVGPPRRSPNDEVYFSLEALSEAAASTQAEEYMKIMLGKAALEVGYVIELQRTDRA